MSAHPWLQTRDGHVVDLVKPDLTDITIEELAHALASLARFSGHTRPGGYSVAQHSVIVSENVPSTLALDGLLHDIHEAIMGDITSPVKRALAYFDGREALKKLEHGLRGAVARKWGVNAELPYDVHEADMRALVTERRDLMGDLQAQDWEVDYEPFEPRISCWTRAQAEIAFLDRFRVLTVGREAA